MKGVVAACVLVLVLLWLYEHHELNLTGGHHTGYVRIHGR